MSESHDDRPPAAAPEPDAAEPPAPPSRRRVSAAAIGLAVLLVLVLAGIAASPFWAPAIAPLLPWAEAQPKPAPDDPQLAARVARLEGLTARLDKLEALAVRPDKTGDLVPRLDRLDAAAKDAQQQAAAAAAAAQKLEQRLAAAEAKPTSAPADLGDLRQQLDKLAATVSALGGRLDAIEKTARTQAAADATDTGLLLVLLQMRDAIAAGRPFTAEYDAFAALAHERPEIAKAAAPLAGAAQGGVASREVLRQRLDALAADIANAEPPPAAGDWQGQAWARMRSLVTIRRISGAAQNAPESAVGAAQQALAAGDLPAAIAKLKGLTGPSAEAAKPWLQMAEARVDTEQALRRIEQLLTARLAAQHKPSQP